MSVTGLKKFRKDLDRLAKEASPICHRVVYVGAGEIADAVRGKLSGLQAVPDTYSLAAYQKGEPGNLTVTQKAGLLSGLGIAKMQDDGDNVNASIGFDGYNGIRTARWPEGQPNQMIARATESGSSAMNKRPFFRAAVNGARTGARKKMEETFHEEVKKIIN